MTTRWTPVEVDAAKASPDFWARYHAFRRLRHAETRPDDPITPDDVVEKEMKRDDPFNVNYRFEIAAGGQMLSWFDARAVKPGSPEYESSKHLLWADGSVHRDHRRQGIGRSWIPVVLDIMIAIPTRPWAWAPKRNQATRFSNGLVRRTSSRARRTG